MLSLLSAAASFQGPASIMLTPQRAAATVRMAGTTDWDNDEPWHATSQGTISPTAAALQGSKPDAVKAMEEAEAAAIEAGEAKPSVGGAKPGWTDKRAVAVGALGLDPLGLGLPRASPHCHLFGWRLLLLLLITYPRLPPAISDLTTRGSASIRSQATHDNSR